MKNIRGLTRNTFFIISTLTFLFFLIGAINSGADEKAGIPKVIFYVN